ncbi:hypothetical protein ABK040_009032 [Willaertia magna]
MSKRKVIKDEEEEEEEEENDLLNESTDFVQIDLSTDISNKNKLKKTKKNPKKHSEETQKDEEFIEQSIDKEKGGEEFIENLLSCQKYDETVGKFIKSLENNLIKQSSIDFQLIFYNKRLKEQVSPVKWLANEIRKEWRLLEEPLVIMEQILLVIVVVEMKVYLDFILKILVKKRKVFDWKLTENAFIFLN